LEEAGGTALLNTDKLPNIHTYKHSFGLALTMADVQYLSNQLEGVSVQDENYDTHAPPVPLKAKVC
jgi:hypothetical protein